MNSRSEKKIPALLAVAFDVMDQGIGVFDNDLTLIVCNRRFIEIRNYPPDMCKPGVNLEELLRHNAARGDYGDGDVEAFLQQRFEQLRSLKPHEVERQIANGRTINVRYDPIPAGGLLASFIDITDLRQAEQQVRELADLPEQNPGPVLRFSGDGVLIYANPASDTLRLDANVEIGDSVPDFWRSQFEWAFEKGEQREVEYCHEERTYSLVWYPVQAGGSVNIYGRDITDLRQAEQTVRELAKLPEQNPGPFLRFSRDGALIYGNQASDSILKELGLKPGDPAPESLHDVLRRATETLEVADVEREFGDSTFVLTVYPVAETGNVNIYGRDITKRKQAEQRLIVAKNRAELALRELEQAQKTLVQAEKMASLGQLTAGIAHEIKNPLNFIKNFSEVSGELIAELKDALSPAMPALEREDREDREDIDDLVDTISENLTKIEAHANRADRIVKSMLAHARQGPSTSRLVDLNALLEDSLNLAYHGARAENQDFNIALERDFDPGICEIEVFPQELMRVFLNLMSNGFYATYKRQCAERSTDYRPVLKVSTRQLESGAEIRVRDNGTGIPDSVVGQIFEPFYTTKPTGEGTGLGLSMSHEIVAQQHHGQMEVATKEGEFTEFVVRLPAKV